MPSKAPLSRGFFVSREAREVGEDSKSEAFAAFAKLFCS